ncbi:hypothetical protein GCM10022295_01460 [Streptomyces osmaniensis]|uniref:Uncharacterized protein n=1 Tax=Streptomyces osmaniensis TaxID=593134 RepID=A0ABP6UYH6_9ACTN
MYELDREQAVADGCVRFVDCPERGDARESAAWVDTQLNAGHFRGGGGTVFEADYKWGVTMHDGSPVTEEFAGTGRRAWHERLVVSVQKEHRWMALTGLALPR